MVAVAAAPHGTEGHAVQWVKVTVPDVGVMLAAVARPSGRGPFPAVLILHGTHGFAREYVQLAEEMARNGVVGVAACWFRGSAGAGSRFVTPIECPDAPPMPVAASADAFQAIDGLVEAVHTLPDIRADRVALFGHSRGGGAALHYVLARGAVQGAILNSAGYPPELGARAADVGVPILILHGVADDPADGGSPMTNVRMARDFEAALRRSARTVEATYYDGGHNSIFTNAAQHEAEVQRMVTFLRRHLGG